MSDDTIRVPRELVKEISNFFDAIVDSFERIDIPTPNFTARIATALRDLLGKEKKG